MARLRRLLALAAMGALSNCGNNKPPAGADAGCPGPAFDGGLLNPAEVAAGEALVTQWKCEQCHGTTLSGNDDGVTVPNGGTMQYPPNLTNDPATGLGCWTDDQIENAILESVDNLGNAICAPMPHFSALGLSQTDAAEIAAYLRSLPVFSNNAPSGPDCSCPSMASCFAGQTCLDGGWCTCESLACAIPGTADGGETDDGGLDAGLEDAGHHGRPDAGSDGGLEDGGKDGGAGDGGGARDAGLDGGRDAGADAGPLDAGSDAGPLDAGSDGGPPDSGFEDAGRGDAGPDAG